MKQLIGWFLTSAVCTIANAATPRCISGIYPNLAMFNNEGECGTGAVVPWQDRLWTVTYAPHAPNGSSDKLYEITPEFEQRVHAESVGGTPANRMIHRESQQLFIGPYVIDAKRNVRVIPPSRMFGRLTANMRHLTDPANKIYYATMEEGFYEVDVHTLAVRELYQDGNRQKELAGDLLPGYHGKGAYSSQGLVVYANNGERNSLALRDPTITSGVLAQWNGKDWEIVLRNQFTEVTGPGGIYGNPDPKKDPLWSIGWDYRSLILMCLDGGRWYRFRLPKGSHSYDGAHGWNTEWPRIRDIGESTFLMTMHGTFWHFPKTFTASDTGGIRPRSNYLKVIGDFCRWGDRIVMGCDDSAKSEFLNKRQAKGTIKGPGQSNSNLWFVKPEQLDRLGPVIGRGAVWSRDAVTNGVASDPYLFAGYQKRTLFLTGDRPISVAVEFNDGRSPLSGGTWTRNGDAVQAEPGRVTVCRLPADSKAVWCRLVPLADASSVYAFFQYANPDTRGIEPDVKFRGIARDVATSWKGIVYSRGANLRTAALGTKTDFYELTPELKLVNRQDAKACRYAQDSYPMNGKGVVRDAASVVVTDDHGKRWRFPISMGDDKSVHRVCREVSTERDLLNLAGTFYELPAENAGGYSKVRAVATHGAAIDDYCSWSGMLLITGIDPSSAKENPEHIVVSDDAKTAVWLGAIDDLWAFGKPRGIGGPWKNTSVRANEPSDPYLLAGFDRKRLTLSATGNAPVRVTLELDITGEGVWREYESYRLESGTREIDLGDLPGYWARLKTDRDCTVTAQFTYE
ncbi:MAG: hypothetical protein IJR99_13290 [Kiritimatiellae bacterium]|nr:hypothetical protein [Kiritimatiellia bacterium]